MQRLLRGRQPLREKLFAAADGKQHFDPQTGDRYPDAVFHIDDVKKLRERNWDVQIPCEYLENYRHFLAGSGMLDIELEGEGWARKSFVTLWDGEEDADAARFERYGGKLERGAGASQPSSLMEEGSASSRKAAREEAAVRAEGGSGGAALRLAKGAGASRRSSENSERRSAGGETAARASSAQTSAQASAQTSAQKTVSGERREDQQTTQSERLTTAREKTGATTTAETTAKRTSGGDPAFHPVLSRKQKTKLLMLTNLLDMSQKSNPNTAVFVVIVGGRYLPIDIWPARRFPNLIVLYMRPYFQIPRVARPLSPRTSRPAFADNNVSMEKLNKHLWDQTMHLYRGKEGFYWRKFFTPKRRESHGEPRRMAGGRGGASLVEEKGRVGVGLWGGGGGRVLSRGGANNPASEIGPPVAVADTTEEEKEERRAKEEARRKQEEARRREAADAEDELRVPPPVEMEIDAKAAFGPLVGEEAVAGKAAGGKTVGKTASGKTASGKMVAGSEAEDKMGESGGAAGFARSEGVLSTTTPDPQQNVLQTSPPEDETDPWDATATSSTSSTTGISSSGSTSSTSNAGSTSSTTEVTRPPILEQAGTMMFTDRSRQRRAHDVAKTNASIAAAHGHDRSTGGSNSKTNSIENVFLPNSGSPPPPREDTTRPRTRNSGPASPESVAANQTATLSGDAGPESEEEDSANAISAVEAADGRGASSSDAAHASAEGGSSSASDARRHAGATESSILHTLSQHAAGQQQQQDASSETARADTARAVSEDASASVSADSHAAHRLAADSHASAHSHDSSGASSHEQHRSSGASSHETTHDRWYRSSRMTYGKKRKKANRLTGAMSKQTNHLGVTMDMAEIAENRALKMAEKKRKDSLKDGREDLTDLILAKLAEEADDTGFGPKEEKAKVCCRSFLLQE